MVNTWEKRLKLAQLGWITELELKKESKEWFFTSRVERWDWHQHRCDRVGFYNMGFLDIKDTETAMQKMYDSLTRASNLALRAWEEFPDSIPRQNTGSNRLEVPLEVEPIATRIIFAPHSPANCHPTEFVTLEGMVDEEEDVTLLSILAIASQDINYQDKFTCLGRNINSPYKNRTWGLDYCLTPITWHGKKLRYSPLHFSLESNLESLVGASLMGSLSSIRYLKTKYQLPNDNLPNIRYRSSFDIRTDEEILASFEESMGTIKLK